MAAVRATMDDPVDGHVRLLYASNWDRWSVVGATRCRREREGRIVGNHCYGTCIYMFRHQTTMMTASGAEQRP